MASPAPFSFLPLGAIIQSFIIGTTNIVQNFPNQSLYSSHNAPYFGETIGRVANRISSGKIEKLNGRSYQLAINNAPNALHGGPVGWGKRIWEGPRAVGIRGIPGVEEVGGKMEGGESVVFSLRSEDGEEGYPGTVEARVVYTAGTQRVGGKEVRVLGIEYEVRLLGDEVEETVVNVTNHSYFNLTGKDTIEGTEVSLCSTNYLPVDEGGIPKSSKTDTYPGITANKTFVLGSTEPDIDDCFIVDPSTASSIPLDTRSSPLTKVVTAYHPASKIHLEVLTTEPAFQFYTGKYIDVPAIESEGVRARGPRSGFCVEPSRYVNAVNVEEWRGQVVLKRGEVYGSRIVYRGWSDE